MLVTSLIPVTIVVAVVVLSSFPARQAQAQNDTASNPTNAEWLEFRQAVFVGEPILLHLKTGQARAVVWPEPIELLNDKQQLPGCAVEIDNDVVAFFPLEDFNRMAIQFRGLETQIVYELQIRASSQGIEEPLQITR